ncbi:MAG: hypothetical protein GXZ11_08455 [Tissierellia bacterium]|nr:hypothetical protein [Tissierellia bacterium]
MKIISNSKAKLNGFQLKILALVLMLIDHIHYIFDFTGSIPLLFKQVGRLSAPIFLFIFIQGFIKTKNREKFFTRIYIVYFLMGIVYCGLNIYGGARSDGFIPQNAIFSNFIILFILFSGIEEFKNGKLLKGVIFISFPIVYDKVFSFFISSIGYKSALAIWTYAIFPAYSTIMDGGIFYILTGLLLYIFVENRRLQVLSYVLFTLGIYIVYYSVMIPNFNMITMFNSYYQWMSVFAAPFMLLYNGERGKDIKSFFYVFYPLHIYILYAISMFIQ